MRLIDVDAAIAQVEKREQHLIPDRYGDKMISTESLKAFLRNRPTVDGVRHGKWIEMQSKCADITWCMCSECGEHLQLYTAIEANEMYKYCRNCGALMDRTVA